jgi:hypothetical protein
MFISGSNNLAISAKGALMIPAPTQTKS